MSLLHLVLKALLVLLDLKDKKGTQVAMENLAIPDELVIQENLVALDLQEKMVHQAIKVLKAVQETAMFAAIVHLLGWKAVTTIKTTLSPS